MLNLRRDVFTRLVLSAQKDKPLNKPFRVVHADKWDNYSSRKVEMPSKLDETVSTASTVRMSNSNNLFSSSKSKHVDKIDEKVEKIISDPVLLEIKAELEFAEALLEKIKSMDKNNVKIPAIEQTVSRLKQTLEQKMYV
jgi:hypothetical protein